MNDRTKTGLHILLVALIVGLAGDLLLRATPWGANVLIFNLVFVAGMASLIWKRAPQMLTKQTIALFGALIFFASMFVWRDAIELRVADSFAIVAIISVLFVPRMKIAASVADVIHYIIGFFWSAFNAFFAPFVLLSVDIKWNVLPKSGWSRNLVSALRGIAIAAPLILIFGALFMAADAAFEGLVQRVFNIEADKFVSHIFLFSFFSWLTAGYLRGVLITAPAGPLESEAPSVVPPVEKKSEPVESVRIPYDRTAVEHLNISDPPNVQEPDQAPAAETQNTANTADETNKSWDWRKIDNTFLPSAFTLGPVEIGVVLGLVNLLFLSFVIMQVPYLFGGMELVQSTPDFKLADYARRGFGELVAVAGLTLPMLLVSHWLLKAESKAAQMLFRILAGIQIALLFVIMASAVQRLALLTGNLGYGMTTVRLYPLIFMSWLGLVFLWFGATVLRGARQHFAWGALWLAILILGATHFLNPDQFIVKTNIALMQQGREFDAYYNSSLSDDAIPSLIEAMPQMSAEDRCEVGSAIHYRYRELGKSVDFRSYNISQRTAWRYLHESDGLLHQTAGCPERFQNDKPVTVSEE